MAPIRVGLVGLRAYRSSTNWACLAHLPYLQQSSKYQIVALCNSSVESAQRSVKHYNLPESTKAYGSPDDLAKDPDVDLAVVVVNIVTHYDLALPLVKAGKDVYCELPFASNIDQIRELASEAKERGIKTIFGAQAAGSAEIRTIKSLIDSGAIGIVQSSTVTGNSGLVDQVMPAMHKSLLSRSDGGHSLSIFFLHTFSSICHALGEVSNISSKLATLNPKIGLFDNNEDGPEMIQRIYSADAPDTVSFQARLQSGGILTVHMNGRRTTYFGEPGLRWHIIGDKGEIMLKNDFFCVDVIASNTTIDLVKYRFLDGPDGTKLRAMVKDQHLSLPERIEPYQDALSKLPGPAQGVGRIYEAFADGDSANYMDWQLALKRHELLQDMYDHWEQETHSL